ATEYYDRNVVICEEAYTNTSKTCGAWAKSTFKEKQALCLQRLQSKNGETLM
ncbi:22174_t:CDS:1, partial [Dentiscutata erythropus]